MQNYQKLLRESVGIADTRTFSLAAAAKTVCGAIHHVEAKFDHPWPRRRWPDRRDPRHRPVYDGTDADPGLQLAADFPGLYEPARLDHDDHVDARQAVAASGPE